MADGMRRGVMKRKGGSGDGKFQHSRKGKKAKRVFSGGDDVRVKKMDWKTKKFFQRKARDYDSDGDDDDDNKEEEEKEKEEEEDEVKVEKERFIVMEDEPIAKSRKKVSGDFDVEGEGEEDGSEQEEVSEDENGEVQPGILRFSGGCKTFRLAFQKITMKTNPPQDDVLGPILSANKSLIAEKLAEEDAERKVKTEAKKEKHLVGEKGHVKPENYLDSHEKSLIGTATRGVVKLFNAVNKAQYAQKGLNPKRAKDEKVLKKRRKEAFFSVLGQTPSNQTGTLSKVESSSGTGSGSGDAPAWAPLRDNYMLTNSKLKDWDKMKDTTTAADDFGMPPGAVSSSDDE